MYADSLCEGLTGHVFRHSPLRCEGWIRCHENVVVGCGECDGGRYFDIVLGGCLYPEVATCGVQSNNMCRPGENHRVPREDSCTIYYQCVADGDPIEHRCAEDLQFNSVTEQCDITDNVRCLREPLTFECPASAEIFTQEPHPWLCDRYFVCLQGQNPLERSCLDEMQFDINTRTCRVAAQAQPYPGCVNAPALAFV